jgi:type IV pilus assembly protein PilB
MLSLGVVPVEVKTINQEKTLRVAMSDPTRVDLIDNLQFMTGCRILPVLASEDEILQAIRSNMPKVPAPEPVADFGGTAMNDFHLVDFSAVDTQDPRLERLVDMLQQKGILSAYDVEKIKLG